VKVLILDGYNLIYRAKHSVFGKKRDKDDVSDRSIVFAFTRSIRSLINQHQPDKLYLVLEGRPAARLNLAEDYKANRVYEKDAGFKVQRRLIKELIAMWPGMRVIRHSEHECDDLADTLAKQYAQDGQTVVIVSSDTDFCQSISERISVFNPVKKRFIESPVAPEKYVLWKALRGDPGDNIEGFQGIGNVRAQNLIENPASLSAFLQAEGAQEKFEHNKKMIAFEPVDVSLCENVFTLNDNESISKFRSRLHELGFLSITSDKAWKTFVEPIINVRN